MAFYRKEAGAFVPTSHCIGPWDSGLQHGGPPAALLGGAAERFGDDASAFAVVRVTVELLRPIRLVPLTVAVTPVRRGRQAQWLQADLTADGKLLARATVVRVARSELSIPDPITVPEPAPSGPEGLPDFPIPLFRSEEEGYHRAVDVRIVQGEWGKGPMTVWMRAKFPLIEGHPRSTVESALVVADASNGIAPVLPVARFGFINPDLTVHFQRPPEGEWLALAARSLAEPTGSGLVQSQLFDHRGEVGRCLQSLVVTHRGP